MDWWQSDNSKSHSRSRLSLCFPRYEPTSQGPHGVEFYRVKATLDLLSSAP